MVARTRSILRREVALSARIPYTAHISGPAVVRTRSGHYVQTFQLSGASFECADPAEINGWHERLNVLYRSIASPNLAVWTHLIRRRDTHFPGSPLRNSFAARLDARYHDRIAGQRLMRNDLYLSLVYRPAASVATGTVARWLARMRSDALREEVAEALEAAEKLRETVLATLSTYEPEALGTYMRRGCPHSRLLEFLNSLIDGEVKPVPLPRAPLQSVLGGVRPSFGFETLEVRSPTGVRLGAMLGIKEYAKATVPGVFNSLSVGAFSAGAYAVLQLSEEEHGSGIAPAPIQPIVQRRGLRDLAGGRTEDRAR